MSQTMERPSGRIRPTEVDWEMFQDPHERPTCPVRMMKTDPPSLLDVDFPPNFYAGLHWHPFDTLYFVVEGEMLIGPEGSFVPGDVRWVKAGHPYGPEEASDKGVRFFLISMGDDVGLNWADIYDVPDNLAERLDGLPDRIGRVNINDVPPTRIAEGCEAQTLCDSDPFIQRICVAPGATLANYKHGVDALYMVRGGSMRIGGQETYQAEDWRWVRAGQETDALTAGSDGVDLFTIGVGGTATFDWV